MNQPAVYEIRILGQLSEGWSDWLAGMAISLDVDADGRPVTLLTGTIIDQAALHGVLARLRDLNLVILSVVRSAEP